MGAEYRSELLLIERMPVLYYVHDPMCSWCWGFRKVWQELQEQLNGRLTIKYVLGGLAPDSDLPMPSSLQETISNTWRKIQQEIPGTEFNYNFWTECQPRRSTYPACRAIIACRMQQTELEMDMLLAIQQAYYLYAKNPSDNDVLIQLASDIGLNAEVFEKDIKSDTCQKLLLDELQESRRLYVHSFPSLVLSCNGVDSAIAIDYNNSRQILQSILSKM